MEEIYNNTTIINEDYIPFSTNKWKNVYNSAINYLKTTFPSKEKVATEKLDSYLDILIKYGDVEEDVVLKTAIYFFLCKNYALKSSNITDSDAVKNGLKILLENEENSLSKIFQTEDYKYLNKILLANLIISLKSTKKSKKLVENIKISNEVKVVLEKYKNYCHGGLYKMLLEEV